MNGGAKPTSFTYMNSVTKDILFFFPVYFYLNYLFHTDIRPKPLHFFSSFFSVPNFLHTTIILFNKLFPNPSLR